MISKELKISITHFGLTMAGPLVVTHSFLPPHPGITAVTEEYGADIAMVLVYGIIIPIPTIIVAGICFQKSTKSGFQVLLKKQEMRSYWSSKTMETRRHDWIWY